MRISSADWFKAGVARQRVGPISLGIAPRACMILSKLLLLLLLLPSNASSLRTIKPLPDTFSLVFDRGDGGEQGSLRQGCNGL